ncbi:MAG: lytic transglycosylase domain-containing protein [Pyrinomonadaceae bacterium]
MKNITLFVLIILVFAGLSYSQTRERRVYDNFDTKKGVEVIITPYPLTPSPKTSKQPVKKNTQNTVYSQSSPVNKPATSVKLVNKTVMSVSRSLSGYSTGDSIIDSYIVESSSRYGVDPLLIYAQMNQESSFKLKATSYKGARGLMQLMPATAVRFGVTNIYDPKQNIEGGVKYMRWLLDAFGGDVNLALAGYNAGEGAVMKYGNRIPPYAETQEYVRRITARYNSIKRVNTNTQKSVKKPFSF